MKDLYAHSPSCIEIRDYTEASWSDLRQDSPANPRHRIPLLYKSLNETKTVYVKAGGCGCGCRCCWCWCGSGVVIVVVVLGLCGFGCGLGCGCGSAQRIPGVSPCQAMTTHGSADELGLGGGGVRIRLPQSIHVPTMITSIRLRPFPQSIHVPTMITSRSDSIHSCGASMSQP